MFPWLPARIPLSSDGTAPTRKPAAPCPWVAVPGNGLAAGIEQSTEGAWLCLRLTSLRAPRSPGARILAANSTVSHSRREGCVFTAGQAPGQTSTSHSFSHLSLTAPCGFSDT